MWLQRTRSQDDRKDPGSASENTTAPPAWRRGRAAVALSAPDTAVLDGYIAALRAAPLSEQTRRTYTSKVRQYLAWLADADLDEDPLTSADGRDRAVRDYRTHIQTVLKRSPVTVNNALAAVDDFYIRRGLGPASAARVEIPAAAPRPVGNNGTKSHAKPGIRAVIARRR